MINPVKRSVYSFTQQVNSPRGCWGRSNVQYDALFTYSNLVAKPLQLASRKEIVTRGTLRPCSGFYFQNDSCRRHLQRVLFSTISQQDSIDPKKIEKKKKSSVEIFPSLNDPKLLTVAILGPPNAGKSTLYNRLVDKTVNKAYRLNTEKNARRIRKRAMSQSRIGYNATNRRGGSMAIVSSMAGTTRDRRECVGRIGPTFVRLMDTAGVDGRMWQRHQQNVKTDVSSDVTPYNREKDLLTIEERMMNQSLVAAQKADLILLMFDARRGITGDFLDIVRWLRKLPPNELPKSKGQRKGGSKDAASDMDNIKIAGGCESIDLEEMQREVRSEAGDSSLVDFSSEEADSNIFERQRVVAVLANKLEGDRWALDEFDQTDSTKYESISSSAIMDHLAEAARLGLGEPIPISAEHGDGMSDIAVIAEALTKRKQKRNIVTKDVVRQGMHPDDVELEQTDDTGDGSSSLVKEKPLQLAILGRPNVGKSTLVNALLKEDRVVTGATPGLTRDAISVEWTWDDRPVKIVDTAGIRKKKQRDAQDPSTSIVSAPTSPLTEPSGTKEIVDFDPAIEDLAVQDAMRAMKTADVAVLVVEASQGLLQRQEIAIVDAVVREGRAIVIAANKMDLLEINAEYRPEHFACQVQEQIETRVPVLRNTPVVAMSSLKGKKVDKLMPVVFEARERWSQKISTGLLNRWLQEVIDGQPPPLVQGRQVKIKYIMQTKGRPPTFLLFASTDKIPETYIRYLTRNFQDTFRMFGMEVRLALKLSSPNNPYHTKAETDGPRKGLTRRKTGGSGIGGAERRKEKTLKQLRTYGRVDKSRRARKLGKW